jgi:hypothetical protein
MIEIYAMATGYSLMTTARSNATNLAMSLPIRLTASALGATYAQATSFGPPTRE